MTSPSTSHSHPTLKLFPKCKTLETLKQIQGHMLTSGLFRHTFPLGKLLFLSSTFSISYALSIFHRIPNPSVFLYNTLISSAVSDHRRRHESSHTQVAFALYMEILCSRAVRPNAFTYPSLFKAFGSHTLWRRHGRALHAHVLKFLEPDCRDRFVRAAVVGFYANCGKLGVARFLFDQIMQPDLATWNTVLAAYSSAGDDAGDLGLSVEVLRLFEVMQRNSSVNPNEISLVALITACANSGAFGEGVWAHAYLMKNSLKLNHFVGTSLINFYTKFGCLDAALQVFDKIPQRDSSCFNAMIHGLAIHGLGREALMFYEKMISEGFEPDDVTFVVTICACSHAGLVDEGLHIFSSIRGVHGIEPKVEHYGCLVDLLGRAGRLNEAEEWIEKMPMKPNATLWRAFLGAARVHGDLKRAEVALKHLLGLEPENSGNYVLLSNTYAGVDRWDDVKRVRELMRNHRVDKSPGMSLDFTIMA